MTHEKLKFQDFISTAMDALTVFISYVLAVYIRYHVMESKPGLNTLSTPYLLIALAYSVIIASILGYVRQSGWRGSGFGMGYSLFAINAVGCLFLFAFLYTIGEQYFSRWALVLFWLISGTLLLLQNILLTLIFNKKHRALSRSIRVVMIGSGRNCGDYIRAVGYEDTCDFTIVGYIGEKSRIFFERKFEQDGETGEADIAEQEKKINASETGSKGWLGGYSDAEAILKRTRPDEVVFALEDGEIRLLEELLPVVRKLGIKSCLVPGFGRYISEHAVVRCIDELKIIDLDNRQEEKGSAIYGLGLTLSSVFLILILVIKRFNIGNAGSLGLYETYRCFLFALAGAFLFFFLRGLLREKRYGNTAAALGASLISMAAIVLYETAYTQGSKLTRDTGYDLKMTLSVIVACWAVKAIVDYISKDDYPILM